MGGRWRQRNERRWLGGSVVAEPWRQHVCFDFWQWRRRRVRRWCFAVAPELAIAVVGRLPERDLLERIEHEIVPAAFRSLALAIVAADDEPFARARQAT